MNRKGRPRNIAASVRARLTQRARDRQENVQLALIRYAIERLLYRLGLSSYRGEFVLKGAMLFSLWAPTPYRSTGDLDLLGFGDPAPERIVSVFREICSLAAADDGVVFKPETIQAHAARLEEEYSGIRLTIDAEIAGARLPLQIDIGFGDIVTPGIQDIDYPSLLGMPLPHLRAYPPETVVAEKLQLLRSLGHLGDLCLCRIDSRPCHSGDIRTTRDNHSTANARCLDSDFLQRFHEASPMARLPAANRDRSCASSLARPPSSHRRFCNAPA